MDIDTVLLREINRLAADPTVAAIGRWWSSPAAVLWVCGPVAGFLAWMGRYRALVAFIIAMGLADVVTGRLLKPAFARPRPCHTLKGLVPVVPCGPGKSMPSGHATVAFAFLATAASGLKRGWWWLAPPAVAVAGSRVVLGVHYPSDVVAGAAVGLGIGWVVRGVFPSQVVADTGGFPPVRAGANREAAVKKPTHLPANDRADSIDGDPPGR